MSVERRNAIHCIQSLKEANMCGHYAVCWAYSTAANANRPKTVGATVGAKGAKVVNSVEQIWCRPISLGNELATSKTAHRNQG